MLNNIILIVFSALLLSSCSTNITSDEARDNANSTIEDVVHQKEAKVISTVDYESAIDNIISFEQRGFVGKYWWVVVLVGVWIIIISVLDEVTDTSLSRDMMKRPMTKTKAYTILFCLGIFGGHYFYLNKHKWLAWITILLLLIIPLWNYKPIMYFYDIPSLLFIQNVGCFSLPKLGLFYITESILLGLFVLNFIIGLVSVPFWVYQFNGNYFRKHTDNDAILSGKDLPVDSFFKSQFWPNYNQTKEDADFVNEVSNNDDLIIYNQSDEKIDGFFKYILTLGKSTDLKNKIGRLRALRNCCEQISEDLDQFEIDNNKMYDFLVEYRIAAYRNLYLAKELLGIIKDKISSKQQKLIIDEFPLIMAPTNNNPSTIFFDAHDVQFNTESFMGAVGRAFESSLDTLSSRLNNEKNISKYDFIEAGIEFGLNTILAAIDELFSMYSRYNDALLRTETNINRAIRYLNEAIPAILSYQAELKRQAEIVDSLNKCNKAFVHAYEPLRKMVFGDPTFLSYIKGVNKEQEIYETDDFRMQLHHLINVCSLYNKVYNAKTGYDGDRINKPNKPQYSQEQPAQKSTREQVLDIIKDNVHKRNISEETAIDFLKLDKNKYSKSALCIRLNDTFGTKIKPEHFQEFNNVKDIINFICKNS